MIHILQELFHKKVKVQVLRCLWWRWTIQATVYADSTPVLLAL